MRNRSASLNENFGDCCYCRADSFLMPNSLNDSKRRTLGSILLAHNGRLDD